MELNARIDVWTANGHVNKVSDFWCITLKVAVFAEVSSGQTIMATFEAGPIWCCLSYARKVAGVMLVDRHFGKPDMKFMGGIVWLLSGLRGPFCLCKRMNDVVSLEKDSRLNCLWTVSLGSFTEMNSGKSAKINFQRLKLDQFRSFLSFSSTNCQHHILKIDSYSTLKRFARDCLGEQREIWKIQKSFNFLSPLILIRSNHVTYRWWDKLQANERKSKAKKSSNTRIDWGQVLRGMESMSRGMRGIMAKVAHWIKS